jgi:two-component system sensor histidine kinase YesM
MKNKWNWYWRISILLTLSVLTIIFIVLYLSINTEIIKISMLVLSVCSVLFNIYYVIIPIIIAKKAMEQYIQGFMSFETLRKKTIRMSLSELLYKIDENLNKGYAADILKKQAEINYLQRQINPHFLYNCLDSIRGNAMVVGADTIAEMTEALATFFRYSISQKGSIVTLEEELDNVHNYFIIQQYRFNNKFSIDYMYDQDIDLSNYYLPKLTIQPIVENSIYHGLEPRIGKGVVTIRITITDQRLIINIIDNGIGISQERLTEINRKLTGEQEDDTSEREGIALTNVNKRIKLNFGEKYGLYINSVVNYGTDVELVLPLINNKQVKKYNISDY